MISRCLFIKRIFLKTNRLGINVYLVFAPDNNPIGSMEILNFQ